MITLSLTTTIFSQVAPLPSDCSNIVSGGNNCPYYSFTSKIFCKPLSADFLTSYHSLIDPAKPTATKNYYIGNDVAKRTSLVNSIGVENSTYHLLTHGKPGTLLIEGQWKNAAEIAAWIQNKQLLKDKTHLNIYGCNFAQGEEGQQAVSVLETTLGVSIAASDDITGVDGDWELEVGNARNAMVLETYEYNLQVCDCTEYIYLNEPGASSVLKFEITPGVTGLTEVANATGTTPFIQNSNLIPSPHGVTIDVNGNLWVGSKPRPGTNNSSIRKFNCGGDYLGGSADSIASGPDDVANSLGHLTNLFYANGFLYGNSTQGNENTTPPSGGPTKYDPCTGQPVGNPVCLNNSGGTNGNGNLNWGMHYDEMTGFVYTTANGTNDEGVIYRYTLAQVDSAIVSGNTACFDPFITGILTNSSIDPALEELYGITTDAMGAIYVVARAPGGATTQAEAEIIKYDAGGTFVGSSGVNTTNYPRLMGLVYSMETNLLYAGTATSSVPGTDCISVFDTGLNYLGSGVVNDATRSGEAAKGIAIIKECCPLAVDTTFNYSYCAEDFPPILELATLYECEGIVCEAPWVLEPGSMGVIYDDCKQAIVSLTPDFELTGGCVTFTKEWDGATGCDAFKITINVEVVAKAKSTIANPATICEGGSSTITSTTTNPGQTTDIVAYQWQVSPTSSGVFVDIPSATSATYTPTNPSATQCFRLLTTTTGSCVAAPDNAMCSDTSNIVKFTINPAPTLMTIDTAVCNGIIVDVTASVFSTGSPTGGDLSYHGNAADATNDASPLMGTAITEITTSGKVYVRYELTSTGCFVTDSIEVTVNDNPTLMTIDTTVCSGTMVDVTATVFSTGSPTGGDLSYHGSAADATNDANPLTGTAITQVTTSGKIYVRYELTTGCFVTDSIEVMVNDNPTLMTIDTAVCSGLMVDVTASVFSTSSPAGGDLSYHGSAADATNDASPLTGTAITQVTTSGKIYVRYELTTGCFVTDSIEVMVNDNPPLTATTTCSSDLMTYTITFMSDGIVVSTVGAVDNTAQTVSNIPSGTDVMLTATLSGCITMLDVTSPDCNALADDPDPIPTMSEWGLMIFGLLILNLGIFAIRRKKQLFG